MHLASESFALLMAALIFWHVSLSAMPSRRLEQPVHGAEQLSHPSYLVALHTTIVLHFATFRVKQPRPHLPEEQT